MSIPMILLPVFVQVFLTFALLMGMATTRGHALSSGQTKPKDIALRQPNWPAVPRSSAIASPTSSKSPCCFMF